MSVKIRLTRRGRKKLALYDIVISDSRAPRDGRFIEKIGTYNPNFNPAVVELNDNKALDWLLKGAQPTDSARTILSKKGILFKKHLQVGVNKGAISQEQADEKFKQWIDSKLSLEEKQKAADENKKLAAKKDKLEAEIKINKARAEAIEKKNAPIPVEEPAAEEAVASNEENAEETVAEATEQAPAAETSETPEA